MQRTNHGIVDQSTADFFIKIGHERHLAVILVARKMRLKPATTADDCMTRRLTARFLPQGFLLGRAIFCRQARDRCIRKESVLLVPSIADCFYDEAPPEVAVDDLVVSEIEGNGEAGADMTDQQLDLFACASVTKVLPLALGPDSTGNR